MNDSKVETFVLWFPPEAGSVADVGSSDASLVKKKEIKKSEQACGL